MEQMNGRYIWYRRYDAEVETNRYFSFYKSDTQSHQLLPTEGYDFIFEFNLYEDDKCSQIFESFHGDNLTVDITTDFRNDTCITFKINGESIRINVCDSLQIAQLLSQIDEYGAELPTTTIRHEDERVSLLIEISSLGIRRKPDGSIFMDDVRSTGFVRKKE